ncbi:MAG: hypothetical protein ACI92G_003540 [Candidatus Pelagisphaera sp.]|jgi:hypothetical protein
MRILNLYRALLGALLLFVTVGVFANGGPVARSIEGDGIDLFEEATESTLVLLFVAVECPISNRFAPSVNAIYEEYRSDGFEMRTVYTDDMFSREKILKHRTEYSYGMPALIDFDRVLAKFCGATVTPEAVVYVRDDSGSYGMVYRGRIDNQYVDFGKWRLKATREDLREVLELARKGEAGGLALRTTEAIGCYIGD